MSGALAVMAGSAGIGVVTIEDDTVSDSAAGSASATFTVSNDGTIYHTTSTSGPDAQYAWRVAGAPAYFDVRATLNSGGVTSGTTGSWLNLASSQAWECEDNNADMVPVTAQLLIEIRNSASGLVLDSATIDLVAARTS